MRVRQLHEEGEGEQEQQEKAIEGEEEGNKPATETDITAAIAPITHIVMV